MKIVISQPELSQEVAKPSLVGFPVTEEINWSIPASLENLIMEMLQLYRHLISQYLNNFFKQQLKTDSNIYKVLVTYYPAASISIHIAQDP